MPVARTVDGDRLIVWCIEYLWKVQGRYPASFLPPTPEVDQDGTMVQTQKRRIVGADERQAMIDRVIGCSACTEMVETMVEEMGILDDGGERPNFRDLVDRYFEGD